MSQDTVSKDSKASPLVSVIIPCYNRTEPLKRAIISVLNQTLGDFEVIVVDDASTIRPDDTIESLKDQRIKLLRHDTNRHAAAARNTGVKAARGEFIALLDSDDEWLPDHLQRRVDKIKEAKTDGVYGAAEINQAGERIIVEELGDVNTYPNMLDYLLSGRCRACTPSLFFTKAAFLDILFDEVLLQYQDYDFNIRFHEKYTFAFDRKVTVIVYNATPGNISKITHHPSYLRFLKKHKPKLPVASYIKVLTVISRKTLGVDGRSFMFFRYLFFILMSKPNLSTLKLTFQITFPGIYHRLKLNSYHN